MKKKRMWFTVLASGLLLLVVGTFAWTNFESSIINFFTGSGANNGDGDGGNGEATPRTPGGTLHNDFSDEDGYQHFRDVYVENWGTESLIVRIKLSEYMEVGPGAGIRNNPSENQAVSIDNDASRSIDDVSTWTPFASDMDQIVRNQDTDSASIRDYWQWTMGGQKHFFQAPEDRRGVLDDNGTDFVSTTSPAFITGDDLENAQETLNAEVFTMSEWISNGEPLGHYWVVDVDGYSYWAAPLEPGEATGLLLHKVELLRQPTEDYFYGIFVDAQMATIDNEPDNYQLILHTATDDASRLINRLADAIRFSENDERNQHFLEEMLREAEAAVTPEQRAEVERIREEIDEFFDNLSYETIWQALLDEYPDMFEQMSEDELQSKSNYIEEALGAWVLFEEEQLTANLSRDSDASLQVLGSNIFFSELTRVFSRIDGMSTVRMFFVEVAGLIAARDATYRYPGERYMWEQKALRHYLWNFYIVRDVFGTQDSARIYTTNHELATIILFRHTDDHTVAKNYRDLILTQRCTDNCRERPPCRGPFGKWIVFFANRTWGNNDVRFLGTDSLMDFWNNEKGRQDGANYSIRLPLTSFYERYDAGTLIRRRNYVSYEVRETIWENKWYVPVRVTPLGLSTNTLNFEPEVSNDTINVMSDTPWDTPISNVPWITISNVNRYFESGSFRINVTENDYGRPRTGTVTVTSEGRTERVTVTQETHNITLSPSTLSFDATNNLTDIAVTSNARWSHTSNDSWLSIPHTVPRNQTGNGSFSVFASVNNTGNQRTGTITVTSGGVTEVITVTQSAAALSVYPNLISFGDGMDASTVTVTSDLGWNTINNVPWLTIVPLGPGSDSFRVLASENNTGNQRTGTIAVVSGGVTRTISIVQASLISTPTRTPTPWGEGGPPTPLPPPWGTVGTPTPLPTGPSAWWTHTPRPPTPTWIPGSTRTPSPTPHRSP